MGLCVFVVCVCPPSVFVVCGAGSVVLWFALKPVIEYVGSEVLWERL